MRRISTRRSAAALVALALVVLPPRAARAADAVIYRIFLTDGSTLASYGDFARVADRVVFSMPLGGSVDSPGLELVSLPAEKVDWESTERYADAARAAQYAKTRGEGEYARLTGDIAAALTAIGADADPARRLAMAERTRKYVADWSRASYGYRAGDVAQLSGMLDQLVSELRASTAAPGDGGAGRQRFDLDLVATVGPPPAVPLLPLPTLQESIEQAISASAYAQDSAARVGLLQSIARALDAGAELPDTWRAATRARVTADLTTELDLDRRYASLTRRALARADLRASRADVRGVGAVVGEALNEDDRLGRRRPGPMGALLAALDDRLDAARRLRLARDRWVERAGAFRAYRRELRGALGPIERSRSWLEDIRALAGPSTRALSTLDDRIAGATSATSAVRPPVELQAVHALVASALQLAANASQARRRAILSGDLQMAWEASSAAAGALMLLGRVTDDLDRYLKPPTLR
jgi:hypothetical protein